MPPLLTLIPPHEPDENAQLPGRTIIGIARATHRTIAEQQERNETIRANAPSITRDIHTLPTVNLNGKKYVKEGHTHRLIPRRSHIWKYGHALIELPSRNSFWACNICDAKGIVTMYMGSSTGNAGNHLLEAHRIAKPRDKRDFIDFEDDDSISDATNSQSSSPSSSGSYSINTLFDRANKRVKSTLYPADLVDEFKRLLIQWVVHFQIALVAVENESFYQLLELLNPRVAALLPATGDTVRRWIIDAYEVYKCRIKRELHEQSISMIHISFDLWTAPNSIPLMGVVAHYTNDKFRNCNTMIALKRLTDSHSGENIGALLVDILREFDIIERLGYFITDNASSNDIAINHVLRTLLPHLTDLARRQRRLRCFGHILNLASSAYIYGNDPMSFEAEIMVHQALAREQAELRAWRKHGPIGKLHNIVVFIRRSPQRREAFKRLADDSHEARNLMLIQDNATRWNSAYSMIERAMKKQQEIQLFVMQSQIEKEAYKRIDAEDILYPEDWRILTEVLRHLKPFNTLTKRLQSRAPDAHHGALWEALPSMEMLLNGVIAAKDHYHSLADTINETTKHIATSLDNCWGKLDFYYTAMDDTPVYVAAVVLHPDIRWKYFEDKWTTIKQLGWLAAAKIAVQALWNVYKADNTDTHASNASPSPSFEPDDFESHIHPHGFYDNTRIGDEYETYCTEFPTPEENPLKWWEARREKYPRLSQLAFDLHSIPLMSAECERIFSAAKRFVPNERNGLKDDIVEAMTCLRHWYKAEETTTTKYKATEAAATV